MTVSPASDRLGPTRFAVADIGGTHARFARAHRTSLGAIELSDPVVLRTSDHETLPDAWRAFLDAEPGFEPEGAALALAGPVGSGRFKLTNAQWSFDTRTVHDEIGLPRAVLLNDFEAIAYAVAGDPAADHLEYVAGPRQDLPSDRRITVIGPGTGLGVAHFRCTDGHASIQPTEGAHIDFPPASDLDDRVLSLLRDLHGRVSVERVVSGEGIRWIYAAIADTRDPPDALAVWQAGLGGENETEQEVASGLARDAIRHFVKTLGRVAGDYALSHGSAGVVIAGGLGLRLRDLLSDPVFQAGFSDKGRYRDMMQSIPVKLITHPQPGLLGAAHAFVARTASS